MNSIDPVASGLGSSVGERRNVDRTVSVELIVNVEIAWPVGVPYEHAKAEKCAKAVVTPRMEINVSPRTGIVWAAMKSNVLSADVKSH